MVRVGLRADRIPDPGAIRPAEIEVVIEAEIEVVIEVVIEAEIEAEIEAATAVAVAVAAGIAVAAVPVVPAVDHSFAGKCVDSARRILWRITRTPICFADL